MPRLNGRNASPVASGPKPSTRSIVLDDEEEHRQVGRRRPAPSMASAADPAAVADQVRLDQRVRMPAPRCGRARRAAAGRRRSRAMVRAESQPCSGVPISDQTIATAPSGRGDARRRRRSGRDGAGSRSTKRRASSSTARPIGHVDEQRPAPRAEVGDDAAEQQADRGAARGDGAEEGQGAVAGGLVGRAGGEQREDARARRSRRRRPGAARASDQLARGSGRGRRASEESGEDASGRSRRAGSRPRTSPSRPPSRSSPPKASV